MDYILTFVLRLVPKWVLLHPKQTWSLWIFRRGERMNTNTILKTVVELSVLLLLASCAPTSNSGGLSYQSSATDQADIIGGVDGTLAYAKQNGVVGIYDQQKGGICTGSLIAANLVLTAGHCVNLENSEETIIFFGTSLDDIAKQVQSGNQSNIRFVVKAARHERFGEGRQTDGPNHDVGLLKFEGNVPQGFKIAKMASMELSRGLRAGTEVTLAGYGLNKFKKDPVTGKQLIGEGSGTLRKVDKIKITSVLTSGEEITLDQTQGRGACHGDSGGPAYVFDKRLKSTVVVGFTSRGSGNCDREAVYTGVMGYAQWIGQKSKELLQ